MAILVCGGAGYIGSHVNKQLHMEGCETVVLDNLVYGHEQAVKWGTFVKGDLADADLLEQVFSRWNIEAVFHLAAYAYVGESVSEPEKYYFNNVANTLSLLKVMRRHGCQRMIFSSTCATYGQPEQLPITEDMPQEPVSPYGASKLMVERIFQDYAKAYGLRYVVFRYFNAAGSDPEGELGESHVPETHLIPLVLDAAGGQRPEIKIFGTDYETEDGSCVRDYVHVTDLAEAHVAAWHYLERDGESVFLNLGNSKGTSVLEVIAVAKRVTGRDFNVVLAPRRLGDPAKLVGSSAKAMQVLDWKPKRAEIEMIIEDAWRWHENRKF